MHFFFFLIYIKIILLFKNLIKMILLQFNLIIFEFYLDFFIKFVIKNVIVFTLVIIGY